MCYQFQYHNLYESKSFVRGNNDDIQAIKNMYPTHSRVAIVECGKCNSVDCSCAHCYTWVHYHAFYVLIVAVTSADNATFSSHANRWNG
jgi:hypothetical protein